MAAPSDDQPGTQAVDDDTVLQATEHPEDLARVVVTLRERESEMLKALISSHNLIDLPYSTLEPLLNEHFGFRGAAKQVQRQIEQRLSDGYYTQHGINACFFNFRKFADDLELQVKLSNNEAWAVRLILKAHNIREMCHVADCRGCKPTHRNFIQLQLIEAVERQIAQWGEATERYILLDMGRSIYNERQKRPTSNCGKTSGGKYLNLLFAEVMAKLVIWLCESTAPLLADKVAGHRLPPELVELIAGHYQNRVKEQMLTWQEEVADAEGCFRYHGIVDRGWSRRFAVLT